MSLCLTMYYAEKTVRLHSMATILTVVGELHSLTDWHVSEASEDAELEDF